MGLNVTVHVWNSCRYAEKGAKKMKKKISKIAVGVIGVIIGSAVIFSQPEYNMDIIQDIAATQSIDPTGGDTATNQPTDIENASMEDIKIANTTYINYGEGGVLVNVIKDSQDSEEDAAQAENNDADNEEAIQTTTTPEPEVTGDTLVEEDHSAQGFSMDNTYISSSVELVNACLSEEDKNEVIAGGTKELRVTIHIAAEEEVKQRQLEEIGTAMDDYMLTTTGLSFCNYLQITVEKKNTETGKWKKMKNFEIPVEISVDILPEFQNEEGFFQMLAPNGNVYDLLDDEDMYGQTITFPMRGTGIYALCYQAKIVENETTPVPTAKPSFFGKLMTSDLCLWHWFMCAFFIIGLTWVAAINAKKKRLIFMGIMDVIFLVCAVLGRCLYCWCFLVAFVIILFLVHVWKTKSMASKRK